MKKFFKKKPRKWKYDRRRAMKCVLLEKSTKHDGYCKYMVTIGEKDGTIHKQPAYGVDMQSAIARLVNQERTVKVEKRLHDYPFIVFLLWIALMTWPLAVGLVSDSPHMLLYSFGSIIVLTILGGLWYNYINKK